MILPGTTINYGGEPMLVGGIGVTGGERYYWLIASDGAVSMLPADVIERQVELESQRSEQVEEQG